MRRKTMKRKNKQVGGSHYESLKIEPIELFVKYNVNWFQGEVIKYCSRFLNKNGKQDLLKAIQVCDLADSLGLSVSRPLFIPKLDNDFLNKYTSQFEYSEVLDDIINYLLVDNNYLLAGAKIVDLKNMYYE